MIPYNAITAWSVSHPWPTREQIEQDMLLSKAICDIFNCEYLAGELLLRGGTALNKLILTEPYRYSEDLDFVRTNPGGIGNIMRGLTDIGKATGYQVKTKIGKFPKVYWLGTTQTGRGLKIKIEINTYERTPVLPTLKIKHMIQSGWYTGETEVGLFQFEEIAATKLRALFQRSKGRDLFDLWLLTVEVGVDTDLVCEVFDTYRPEGYSGKKAIANLEAKLQDGGFMSDINNLITEHMRNVYDSNMAAEVIIGEYLSRI
jgi:predicted nucleotidyltransferase component of viral defense system